MAFTKPYIFTGKKTYLAKRLVTPETEMKNGKEAHKVQRADFLRLDLEPRAHDSLESRTLYKVDRLCPHKAAQKRKG